MLIIYKLLRIAECLHAQFMNHVLQRATNKCVGMLCGSERFLGWLRKKRREVIFNNMALFLSAQ